MHVRPVTLEDAAWLPHLADSLFSPWEDDYGAAVATWMGHDTTSGWVAMEDDDPIGFVLIGKLGLVGEGRAHVIEVLALGVLPEVRRRGIGRSLLARVLRQARAEAALEVRLNVAEDNKAARALFEQAGFEVARADDGSFGSGRRAIRMTWRR